MANPKIIKGDVYELDVTGYQNFDRVRGSLEDVRKAYTRLSNHEYEADSIFGKNKHKFKSWELFKYIHGQRILQTSGDFPWWANHPHNKDKS